MYSTLGVLKNSKQSGKLVGTHQKIDRCARRFIAGHLKFRENKLLPNEKQILHFEGVRGPDGLKLKSPGVDEPMHFIMPEHDDGKLREMVLAHQYNMKKAILNDNMTRAAFEAAWMAHAITDGLTPAHHYPFLDAVDDMVTEGEFVKIFGVPIKGIMRGKNLSEMLHNNWLYLGAGGIMTKHIAFEYGCALVTTMMSYKMMVKRAEEFKIGEVDLWAEFKKSLDKVAALDMYDRFLKSGWTTNLAYETRDVLMPEIVRAVVAGWMSGIPTLAEIEKAKK